MNSSEQPFHHLFESLGRLPQSHADVINRQAYQALLDTLSVPLDHIGRCILLRAPRAGHGKTHLLSRIQHHLAPGHEFIPLHPASGCRIDAASVTDDALRRIGRPLPAAGGLCGLDLVVRRLYSLALQPLVSSGEVPCVDRDGALASLRNRPLETFDFQHPSAVTAHWIRDNFEVLGPRLALELSHLTGIAPRSIGFWVDAMFHFAVTPTDIPGRVDALALAAFSSVSGSGDGVAMERLSALLALLSLLMRVVLVADDLEGFSADEYAALRLAAFLGSLRHSAERLDVVLSVNQDIWDSAFVPRLSGGLADRLSEIVIELEPLTQEQMIALLESRVPGLGLRVLDYMRGEDLETHARGVLRAAAAAWARASRQPSEPAAPPALSEPPTPPTAPRAAESPPTPVRKPQDPWASSPLPETKQPRDPETGPPPAPEAAPVAADHAIPAVTPTAVSIPTPTPPSAQPVPERVESPFHRIAEEPMPAIPATPEPEPEPVVVPTPAPAPATVAEVTPPPLPPAVTPPEAVSPPPPQDRPAPPVSGPVTGSPFEALTPSVGWQPPAIHEIVADTPPAPSPVAATLQPEPAAVVPPAEPPPASPPSPVEPAGTELQGQPPSSGLVVESPFEVFSAPPAWPQPAFQGPQIAAAPAPPQLEPAVPQWSTPPPPAPPLDPVLEAPPRSTAVSPAWQPPGWPEPVISAPAPAPQPAAAVAPEQATASAPTPPPAPAAPLMGLLVEPTLAPAAQPPAWQPPITPPPPPADFGTPVPPSAAATWHEATAPTSPFGVAADQSPPPPAPAPAPAETQPPIDQDRVEDLLRQFRERYSRPNP